jgi:ADP-heptose:LPS heptosyltransferase
VNLQFGPPGRALGAILPDMIDAMDAECPLDEFAAAVAATDLLITIDTMAAHCAGPMGHPTWIAVPFAPHWYWSRPIHSPWYPDIVIFRQTVRRDWSGPIAEIAGRLGGNG